jgi:hypothetical protein
MVDKGEFRFTDLIPYLVLADTIRLMINTILDHNNAEEIFNQSLKQVRQQAGERWNLFVEDEDDEEDEEDNEEDDGDVRI